MKKFRNTFAKKMWNRHLFDREDDMKRFTLGLVAVLMMAALPLAAHHSFEAEYDAAKTADLKGFVTKIEWGNPHAHVYLNVVEKDGTTANYSVELGPPYALVRTGWQRSTVNIGDEITMANVALAKDGTKKAGATRESSLVLSTGKKMELR
jgi:hypothetical protein